MSSAVEIEHWGPLTSGLANLKSNMTSRKRMGFLILFDRHLMRNTFELLPKDDEASGEFDVVVIAYRVIIR